MNIKIESKEAWFYGEEDHNYQWGYNGRVSDYSWCPGSDMARFRPLDSRYFSYCLGCTGAHK
jgi:hypothetical protein